MKFISSFLGTLIIALCSNSCVSPDDFEQYRDWQHCEAPHFDIANDELYCTGYIEEQALISSQNLETNNYLLRVPLAIDSTSDYVVIATTIVTEDSEYCDPSLTITLHHKENELTPVGYGTWDGCDEDIRGVAIDVTIIDGPNAKIALTTTDGRLFIVDLVDNQESSKLATYQEVLIPLSYGYEDEFDPDDPDSSDEENNAYISNTIFENNLLFANGDSGICIINPLNAQEYSCLYSDQNSDSESQSYVINAFTVAGDYLWAVDLFRGLIAFPISYFQFGMEGFANPTISRAIPNNMGHFYNWGLDIIADINGDITRVWVLADPDFSEAYLIDDYNGNSSVRLLAYSATMNESEKRLVEIGYEDLGTAILPSLGLIGPNTLGVALPETIEENVGFDNFSSLLRVSGRNGFTDLKIIDVSPGSFSNGRLSSEFALLRLPFSVNHQTTIIRSVAFDDSAIYFSDADRVNLIPVDFNHTRELFGESW